ncbi:MAG: hypothetical protein V3T33_01605 [Myxococcota bacterium]
MTSFRLRIMSTLAAGLLVGAVSVGTATTARAEKKAKSVQTEAIWVAFDAENKTVTAKIRKPGRRIENKEAALKRGREASFNVRPEGSVLTRTSVAVNGRKGELTDIPAGKTVLIYWVLDEAQSTLRFARKIDVIFSAEELAERYGFDD